MFSGTLEKGKDHPNFIEISLNNISLLEEIVMHCQSKGELEAGKAEYIAIKLWSSVHGFTILILENQFPPDYMQG